MREERFIDQEEKAEWNTDEERRERRESKWAGEEEVEVGKDEEGREGGREQEYCRSLCRVLSARTAAPSSRQST